MYTRIIPAGLSTMTSPLVCQALDLYADIFQKFIPFSISWDKKHHKFFHNTNIQYSILFYLAIVAISNILSILFLILRELLSNRTKTSISLANILLLLIFLILLSFLSFVAVLVAFCGKQLITAWNELERIEKLLRASK